MSGTLFFCGAVKTAFETLDWPGRPDIAWGTVGALRDRVLVGERPAVIVVSDAAIADLAAKGLVRRHCVLSLGRTSTGLAVRDGSPRPPIGTAEQFKAALLAAESIAWADASSGATAGRHFESVVAALGIGAAMHAKAKLVRFGVEAVEACGRGEVELAVSQTTEIVNRPGLSLLGEFPPPFALSTGYAAAPVEENDLARAVMAELASPEARAALDAIGFRPA